MHLAVDDRARAPMPSRPSLLGHRSEPLEALSRLLRHSRPGLQCLGWGVGECAGGGQGGGSGAQARGGGAGGAGALAQGDHDSLASSTLLGRG